MAKQEPKAEQGDVVSATLKKPHRHRGFHYPVGAEVKLTKAQAERLTRREVI